MKKEVISAANCSIQKYYFNQEFNKIPIELQKQIKYICVLLAEKLNCIFLIGFYENGDIFFETQAEESNIDYDEIGAKLEIERIKREEYELINSLQIWYAVFKTKEGEEIQNQLFKGTEL